MLHRAAGAGAHAAVGDERAVGAEQAGGGVGGGVGEPAQQAGGLVAFEDWIVRVVDVDGRFAERAGVDAGLFAQGGDFGFEQAVLVLVEVEEGGEAGGRGGRN